MAAVSFPMSPDWAFVVLDAAGGENVLNGSGRRFTARAKLDRG